ncbi:hypothetical protein [Prauserella muralis]|uniref:Uncharacterized protein n=1 Tax=Prauserella muralis TaxID=588067 RepID=A0A2V4B072_9PSEU|nr:hypothetical protein [Prauserella muralis]PXY27546.1 hypothetical protein BAY60_14125 [Prauserella muralis]TWE22731.1 hypothetical protein FHX69_3982 [Prauserella muralis]
MFDGVARWWDGFELWLAQQWFPVQFVLVMAVLVPLCLGLAWLIHRVVDFVADRAGRMRRGARRAGRRS